MSLSFSLAVDFRNFLMNDTTLFAELGARIYPVIADPAVDPKMQYVVYGFSMPEVVRDLAGNGLINKTHLTVISFSQSYDEALGVANYIKTMIDGKTQMIGNTKIAYGEFVDSQADRDDNTKNYLVTQTFTLTHY